MPPKKMRAATIKAIDDELKDIHFSCGKGTAFLSSLLSSAASCLSESLYCRHVRYRVTAERQVPKMRPMIVHMPAASLQKPELLDDIMNADLRKVC